MCTASVPQGGRVGSGGTRRIEVICCGGADTRYSSLVDPPEAVRADGDTGTVFVINGDVVERRSVRLGARNTGSQIILSGLAAATNLAVSNFSKLADGKKICIVQ